MVAALYPSAPTPAEIRAAVELRTGDLRATSAASSSASTSLHSSKQLANAMLKAYVALVCFKCFRYMLQVLYIDVAKVDRDAAHVVMTTSNVSSVLD